MPNFSSLAGLKVTEKFVCGGVGGFQVTIMSNLNPNCLELVLCCIELGLCYLN